MIETVIKKADIYRSGCIVRRQGTVHLEEGSQSVIIGGLKAPKGSMISADSVRLYVPEGVEGNNVQIETPQKEDIKKRTSALSEKISKLEDEIEALDMQRDMWTETSLFSSGTSVTAEGLSDYIEKLPDRLGAVYEKKAARQKELDELREKYSEETAVSSGQYIRAELTARTEGDYPVEISYFVTGVWWAPFYEIHTEGTGSDINIRLRAKITQQTGEDWNGVALSLYSSDPSISGTIPVLRPNYLSFSAPMRYAKASGGKALQMNAMAMNYDMAVCDEEAPMMETAMEMERAVSASAGVRNDETAVEYILPAVWDIASGREVIADLTQQDISTRFHVITVPKLDPSAFLAAEVAVSDIEQLYDTEASVYIKGAYMGDIYISPDMSKDKYDISLGKDETVRVERKQTGRYSSNVLLKGLRKTDLEYEITVTSRKPADCAVTIMDQIPVTTDKTIIVEPSDISGAALDEKTGEIRWDLDLPGGGRITRKLAYSVSHPKDKTLII